MAITERLESNSHRLDIKPIAGGPPRYLQRCLPENDTAAPWKILFVQAADATVPYGSAELREVIPTDATWQAAVRPAQNHRPQGCAGRQTASRLRISARDRHAIRRGSKQLTQSCLAAVEQSVTALAGRREAAARI